MRLSNRVLWFLILFWVILSFYGFYKYFFKLNLTSLVISSNITNFSWSIENNKFSKDFFCEEKDCTIYEIPPFEYKLNILKKNYKRFNKSINLSRNNTVEIFLEKDISVNKILKKELSKRELIIQSNSNNIQFWKNNILYSKIYWIEDVVYFTDNEKLYFYNLKNNNSYFIIFKPEINYIKKLNNNSYLINSSVWSYVFNFLNKEIEYFSIFSDFVSINENYIWIVNNNEKVRKTNLGIKDKFWNLIVYYNSDDKTKFVLENLTNEIEKIYFEEKKLFIENNLWEKFEIIWY